MTVKYMTLHVIYIGLLSTVRKLKICKCKIFCYIICYNLLPISFL